MYCWAELRNDPPTHRKCKGKRLLKNMRCGESGPMGSRPKTCASLHSNRFPLGVGNHGCSTSRNPRRYFPSLIP